MPAEKTQPFFLRSRVLNWTGKGLMVCIANFTIFTLPLQQCLKIYALVAVIFYKKYRHMQESVQYCQ